MAEETNIVRYYTKEQLYAGKVPERGKDFAYIPLKQYLCSKDYYDGRSDVNFGVQINGNPPVENLDPHDPYIHVLVNRDSPDQVYAVHVTYYGDKYGIYIIDNPSPGLLDKINRDRENFLVDYIKNMLSISEDLRINGDRRPPSRNPSPSRRHPSPSRWRAVSSRYAVPALSLGLGAAAAAARLYSRRGTRGTQRRIAKRPTKRRNASRVRTRQNK